LGISENHVLPFGMRENFWEMDVVGPCGPCTEIHYDRDVINNKSSSTKARDLVNAGSERVIELWNLVFMRYNRTGPSSFSNLPSQVVDTGMGLERLCAVLNNLESNYDSDLFLPIFEQIHAGCGGKIPKYNNNDPLTSDSLFEALKKKSRKEN
jgi:alanyl-tRNA synthetase